MYLDGQQIGYTPKYNRVENKKEYKITKTKKMIVIIITKKKYNECNELEECEQFYTNRYKKYDGAGGH